MRKLTLLFLLLVSFAHAQPSARNEALHQLFEEYYEDYLRIFPITATAQGDSRYNDLLHNNLSVSFLNEKEQLFSNYQNKLKSFNYPALSPEDKVSYDILMETVHRELETAKFHQEYLPFNQMNSLPLSMAQLGAGKNSQPFRTAKDYENWLKRVGAFTSWADTAITNFRKGMAAGMFYPKVIVQRMIPQMERLAEPEASRSIFWGPITILPADFSEEEKVRLTAAYERAIRQELAPAYQRLADFLRNEYLSKAPETGGLHHLANGPEMYQFLIQTHTTTSYRPEEIHQIGLREVDRITKELEKLKVKFNFKGSVSELFKSVGMNPRYHPYKSNREVLDAYQHIQQKIEPKLRHLFSVLPKTPFEVRETEAYRAASAPPQYSRGAVDGSRPGIFYIPILDATKMGTASENLFLHEAIPGHHYQLSLQQENTSLPRFRRFANFGVFSEGWGLYAESLGPELGLYADPYQKLLALEGEIFRAVRLVVDTGLHTGKMGRDEAISYLLNHTGFSEQFASSEVDRYIAWPGQALSYKIGELKIKELRDKYQRQLGERFNLRGFHDAILLGGAMPLTVLETYLDQWAAGQ